MWAFILHITGADNVSGEWYGFWSGFGSDISEFALFGALLGLLRKHNCEVQRCWRIGRHRTNAGHMVCRRHHPDNALTHTDVIEAHNAASG